MAGVWPGRGGQAEVGNVVMSKAGEVGKSLCLAGGTEGRAEHCAMRGGVRGLLKVVFLTGVMGSPSQGGAGWGLLRMGSLALPDFRCLTLGGLIHFLKARLFVEAKLRTSGTICSTDGPLLLWALTVIHRFHGRAPHVSSPLP